MKYLLIIFAFFIGFGSAGSAAESAGVGQRPPNIIFILVDDQGYYDLGCYGATEVRTPRIDAMAAAGVRFTDYYAAAPICSPSRAGLLTGRYPRRFGLETWVQRADSKRGLPSNELTLGELFQGNGYATACVGKWHLGFEPQFLPRRHGFDYYFGLLHNLDPVEAVYFEREGGVPLLRNESVIKRPADPAELTRLYTDEAISFIERSQSKPFFLYLPHTMVHLPLGVSAEFKGRSQWGLYGDALEEMDFNVGRIFDALKRLALDQNTVVIYASDNGRGPGRNPGQPLRGGKLTTLEGGIRVPCIAWGPGVGIRSAFTPSTLVHAMDWLPTLATLAGIKVPTERILDGRDLSTLLTGNVEGIPPTNSGSINSTVPLRRWWDPSAEWQPIISREDYNNAFFYHGAEGQLAAVRAGKWKLSLSPLLQLFDLESDPGEASPVRNAAITRKLRGMAVMFQEEMSGQRGR